jgi:hypothetical protein
MTTTNKIIICSGDSYTAGDELHGDSIVPGYTSNLFPLKHDDQELRRQAQVLRDKIKKAESELEKNDFNEYWTRSKERAWPAYLEKLTGIEVRNVSWRGISNQEIVHRAIEQVHRLKEKGISPSNMTVFMMLTSPNRFGAPQHDPKYGGEFEFQSFMPGFDFKPPKIKDFCERIVKDYDDYDLLWFSYSNIVAAKHYLEFLGAKVYILDCCLWGWFLRQYANESKPIRHISLSKSLKIDWEMSATAFKFEKQGAANLPGGHYNEVVHQYLANEIYEALYRIPT